MNCCKTELTVYEIMLAEYYNKIKPAYDVAFAKIYRGEVFGKDCRYYDIMQDLHYLGTLLTLMYFDVIADRTNNAQADWKTTQDWYDKYKLFCIIKKFNCVGVNVKPMIDLFLSTTDGIDYMEEEGTTPPIFIVT